MNETNAANDTCCAPENYEIRIAGHLPDHLADWFDCMTLAREKDGTTTLYGRLPDQSALHGVLQVIGNLNMKLLSVRQLEATADEEMKSKD